MIRAERLLEELHAAGRSLLTGVPCSLLGGLLEACRAVPGARHVPATNEGDAVAVACGAWLGGRDAVAYLQNSGLGNAVNPLTSLAGTFRVPVLLLVTWRGDPEGPADEPQHARMGAITPALLEAMGIPWAVLPEDEAELGPALAAAAEHLDGAGTPYALLVRRGTIGGAPSTTPGTPADPALVAAADGAARVGEPVEPDAALRRVAAATERDAVLATTGFTGRALYALADRPNQLYMAGSMGCVSSLALGLALARPERRVVALDGDGAFLMRMGAVAAVGHARPANLVHVLLDNGVHDSTGAQATVAASVDPAGVARACGYRRVVCAADGDELEAVLREAREGPTFVHVRTLPRAERRLPRPAVAPDAVARRLRAWLASD